MSRCTVNKACCYVTKRQAEVLTASQCISLKCEKPCNDIPQTPQMWYMAQGYPYPISYLHIYIDQYPYKYATKSGSQ
jgi:hypothetical protein